MTGASLPCAFFVTDGDVHVASEATRGPWSSEHQHGGPPAALLAREIERAFGDGPAFRIARLTVAFHKPLAIGRYRTTVESVRDGRKVRLARAYLLSADARSDEARAGVERALQQARACATR